MSKPQPDQRPDDWDRHVSAYEAVFEPFSLHFAAAAIEGLKVSAGARVLDVGAGCGGAALTLAEMGCVVTAVDASARMCTRILERASAAGVPVRALTMDGEDLRLPDAAFDAALSVFGVILFPDAVMGLSQMRRVVRPGGRVAVVTWTEPQAYELSSELRRAISAICPDLPPAPLPAQLRYRERADFEALFRAAGFASADISVHTAMLTAPSARWLGDRVAFAPGMAALIGGLGSHSDRVIECFVQNIEAQQGCGEIQLSGKAFVGVAQVV